MTKEDNAYEEVGRYIIEFQGIHFLLQGYIQEILNKEYWLKKDFWEKKFENIIARILLSERSIDHLLKIFSSLIKELFWEESDDFKITKKVIDFITEKILPPRNDIVHAFLFVDYDNINNLNICRERFKGKTWFSVLDGIKPNHLKEQIDTIGSICILLQYIGENIINSKKVVWKFEYWEISFDVTIESVNNYIEQLRNNLK